MRVYRIVEMDSGQFAVQRKIGLFRWGFVDGDDYNWAGQSGIVSCCFLKSYEDALNRLNLFQETYTKAQFPKIKRIYSK